MKKAFVILHDLVATIVAVVAALAFRFSGAELDGRIWAILPYLPVWVAIAGLVYWWAGLYQSRWRFASILDLWGIAKAVSVLTAILLVIDYALVSQNLVGSYYLGKTTLVLYWIVQCFALGAPRALLRLNRMHKVLKENVGSGHPSLIIGRSKDADVVLRSMEAGLLQGIPAGRRAQPAEGRSWQIGARRARRGHDGRARHGSGGSRRPRDSPSRASWRPVTC